MLGEGTYTSLCFASKFCTKSIYHNSTSTVLHTSVASHPDESTKQGFIKIAFSEGVSVFCFVFYTFVLPTERKTFFSPTLGSVVERGCAIVVGCLRQPGCGLPETPLSRFSCHRPINFDRLANRWCDSETPKCFLDMRLSHGMAHIGIDRLGSAYPEWYCWVDKIKGGRTTEPGLDSTR